MSDQQGSLPVKTLNNGDIVAKLGDGTLPSQLLAIDSTGRITVKLDDSAGNALTSQANGSQRALDVGINVAGVQIDPRSIRALTSADVVTVVQTVGTSLHVDIDASALPSGAATSANQSTIITDLGTIATDLAPLNYAQGAATSGQLASLTLAAATTAAPTLTSGDSYPLSLDLSGSLRTVISEALPAGTNNIGSITNITGTVSLPTGASTSALQTTMNTSLAPLNYAQASTTAGQLGNLGLASATTSAPSLTSGDSYPLSLDLNGSLRTIIAEALPAGANNIGSVNQGSAPWSQNITQISGASPSATNALPAQIAVAGAYVSSTNPIPVTISSSTGGTIINDYSVGTAVVSGGTTNHVYTIPSGKTFTARKFWASSIGALKMDVQTSPDGSTYTTYWTGFNSTANPNIDIQLDNLEIQDTGAGATIRLVLTNEEPLLAENNYSTISGTYQ